MSSVSITATGATKAAVITALEAQKPAGHSSLQGGLVDHLVEHVEDLPDDAADISVSLSAHIGYSVEEAAADTKAAAAGSDQGGA
ncbi:MAG TPA: hypothetical protein VGG49_13130 [Steroidobacteraceae bacterium]